MRKLVVDVGHSQYPVLIESGLLAECDASFFQQLGIATSQKLFILTDEHVGSLYLGGIQDALRHIGFTVLSHSVPAGEASKSLYTYEQVIGVMLENGLDRRSVMIALGGGVVGDLAGFVASTYMRGIPFIQMPTTVLAHDSSIGGKVAINHRLGKNLIGSFYQPLAVLYDTALLSTLPKREISAGLAEVLKLGAIWDATFFRWLKTHAQQLLALEEPIISEALYRACAIKAEIVSQDEKEMGVRAFLNFGHTYGHALEAYYNYQITHGECVGIGMLLAAKLSEEWFEAKGLHSDIEEGLKAFLLPTTLEEALGQKATINPQEILELMARDKKVYSGQHNLILIEKIGQAEHVKNIPEIFIKQSLALL